MRLLLNTFLFGVIICIANIKSTVAENEATSDVQALRMHEVIPDIIDKVPEFVLDVTYSNNLKIEVGRELTPTQVKDKPQVYWDAEDDTFYTLSMTDPDVPSRADPIYREYYHWLVGNIPGNKVEEGEVLADYIGSGPPKDTGLHRYVFLLYKQPEKLTFDEKRFTNRDGYGRGPNSIKKFAEKYNLGDPVAGNMYQAAWDDYVPILYEQIGNN